MSSTQQRLLSLDAFRGATIAGMILVNNPGSWSDIYPQLRHAAWHGWTFTDFIFPFFLWIVGVAMTLSFARRVQEGANKPQLLLHVFRRALIIFGLGLFLNGFPFGLALRPPVLLGRNPYSGSPPANSRLLPDCQRDLHVHDWKRTDCTGSSACLSHTGS